MKILITGASSGIGRDMSKYLNKGNNELILVASNESKLKKLQKEIDNSRIYVCDLSKGFETDKLCEFILEEKPDVVINNAGFGAFGYYDEIDIDREIDMINVNIISVHKISKAAIEYMDEGNYLLNVSSIAGWMPGGGLLNTYYATKNYVRSYTLGLFEESRRLGKKVNISVLCPGPTDTNFNEVAGGAFRIKSNSSEFVAKYAIDKMFDQKLIIVPGFSVKIGVFLRRILPVKLLLRILSNIQSKKINKKSISS